MIDTLKLITDSLIVKIQNHKIPIEILNKESNCYFNKDTIITFITITGTILSVVIGFILSTYSNKLKENKNNYKEFIKNLINYSEGTGNFNSILFYYNQLSNKNKKKYISVLQLKEAKPDDRKKIIDNLIIKKS